MGDFDPDSFLSGSPTQTEVKQESDQTSNATGFDPDAFLGGGKNKSQPTQAKPETIVAPQFAVTGATGLPELAKDIGQGVVKPALQGLGTYAKNPLNILADVGMAHLGVPPLAAAKQMYETYKGVKNIAGNLNEILSKLPAEAVSGAESFVKDLKPADVNKLHESIMSKGLDKAIKEFEAPSYLSKEAAEGFGILKGAIPTMGQKIMGVAGPILRGAGKIAGPAGLAMNAYDAAEFARQAQLGPRLAQGQAQVAPQQFKNLSINQNVSGYTPSPQEAANILSSGDQHTINVYGGAERLNQIAGGQSPTAPPTSTNYIERMKALSHQYGMIGK